MKIAIVCGHFFPELGYIEVHLAREWAHSGHRVTVICSDKIPPYVKHLITKVKPGATQQEGIDIIRLKANFSLGQMVKGNGLMHALAKVNPDLVVCIGVGKLFPAPVYEAAALPSPIITLLGDNEQSFSAGNRLQKVKNVFLQKLLKAPVYRNAIRKSEILFSYTPDGPDVVGNFLGKKWKRRLMKKHHFTSLGFDEKAFYFDAKLRSEYRRRIGVGPSEKLIICFTRVVPEKKLEILPAILAKTNEDFVFLLGGFSQNEYCQKLREIFAEHLPAAKYRLLEFTPHNELNAWYSAADIALYTTAAISIFEALGTGLPLLLPNRKNLSHILDETTNGSYYSGELSQDDLANILNAFSTGEAARAERQNQARSRFGWKQISGQILKRGNSSIE